MRENSNESELIDRVVARYIYLQRKKNKKWKVQDSYGKYGVNEFMCPKKQNNQTNQD